MCLLLGAFIDIMDRGDIMTDRKMLMMGVMFINSIIIVGLFILEYSTEAKIFNETIVGIVIGNGLGLLQAYVTFYTTKDEGDPTK